MTPDEINRAIAESLGWTFIPCRDDGFDRATGGSWRDSDGDIAFDVPNYYRDLNAIQEAVVTLKETDTKTLYLDYLYAVVCKSAKQKWEREWFSVIATAPQRCEAYLRVINLWREG